MEAERSQMAQAGLDLSLWLACMTEKEILCWRELARVHYGEKLLAEARKARERGQLNG
jgi:hypothetical protein